MEELMFVASICRSRGNESVGEMWTETALFKASDSIIDVYRWVAKRMSTENVVDCIKIDVCLNIVQSNRKD